MITSRSIGLDERLGADLPTCHVHLPTTAEVVTTGSGPPLNVPQSRVQQVNRALEKHFSGGYDLSWAGKPEPFQGALILDFVRDVLKYWAYWPDEHALNLATLWTAHTWFTHQDGTLLFNATPRLMIIAPKQSGKTRMLHLIGAMSRNPKGPAVGVVTAHGVKNAMAAKRTLLLDEGHRMFLGRRLDLQGILTGGYTPKSVTLNGYKGEDNDQDIFGPVVIGAQDKLIDSLKSEDLDDLKDRSFIIRPRIVPRWYEEGMDIEKGWVQPDGRILIPQLDPEFEDNTAAIAGVLSDWAASECIEGKKLRNLHSINTDLDSRAYEISIPLCAVADRAVDYSFGEGTPERVRWSIMAREAVCALRLNTGSHSLDAVKESMDKLRKAA